MPLVPYLADHIGRKWTILLGSSLIFLGVVLQTVAVNIGMFIGARFVIGLGIVYTQSCSPMLVTELSHPQYRARLTTIYNTLWYLGSIIASWTTYGTLKMESQWSWKLPSILQAFPSVIQLFLLVRIVMRGSSCYRRVLRRIVASSGWCRRAHATTLSKDDTKSQRTSCSDSTHHRQAKTLSKASTERSLRPWR